MSATITPSQFYRPSSARLVTLDGFVPVPRGATPSLPITPSWPVKDPADVLDYAVDISAAVAGDDGDGVTNVGVLINPVDSGALNLISAAMDGTLAVLWLGGGTAGTIYTVQLSFSFASGRLLQRSIAMPVYSLSGAVPTTAILTTDTGQTLTDAGGNPIVLGS